MEPITWPGLLPHRADKGYLEPSIAAEIPILICKIPGSGGDGSCTII